MGRITNRQIGRYEIKEMIGEGAMAEVYRAFDSGINRSLALKVLKEDFCVDEEYLSRFLREAKAAGALSHQNIVTVYDVGEFEGLPYIMMELLEGQTLGRLLEKEKRLGIEQALIISLQLAKALGYAHEAGIVHRDVKPENIMIQPDGGVKVADFGIARMNERGDVQKTLVGSVLGTPRYMSPEQALGEKVDGRADLFAVGVIMYEMLTGKKAFDSDSIGTLMTQIIQKQPRPIQEYCPEMPAGLKQIIQKLLQKKPGKRFESGGELARALTRELVSYREQQKEQDKQKYLPLKARWSIYMGAIVAVVLFISVTFVINIQSRSMTEQAVDSGAAFAKFIAIETAVPLLSEDWISLETFIAEASSRDTFNYLIVADRDGVIRGASNDQMVGQQFESHQNATVVSEARGVVTSSRTLDDGRSVFDIEAPVFFQSTVVGKIVVGLSQEGLEAVKSVTRWLMLCLAFVTISSVVLVLYIFGGMIAKPLKVLGEVMKSFADGNYDARISLSRNDEIGELFRVYNDMAGSVQTVIASASSVDDINRGLDASSLELSTLNRSSETDGGSETVVATRGGQSDPEAAAEAQAADAGDHEPASDDCVQGQSGSGDVVEKEVAEGDNSANELKHLTATENEAESRSTSSVESNARNGGA